MNILMNQWASMLRLAVASQVMRGLKMVVVAGWACQLCVALWPERAMAGEPEQVCASTLRLSLVKARITRISRDAVFALTAVDTSVGRLFVPSSDPVPTKEPGLQVQLVEPGRLESLIVTLTGQEVVLLVSEDAPGLIMGCTQEIGTHVAPLVVLRQAVKR